VGKRSIGSSRKTYRLVRSIGDHQQPIGVSGVATDRSRSNHDLATHHGSHLRWQMIVSSRRWRSRRPHPRQQCGPPEFRPGDGSHYEAPRFPSATLAWCTRRRAAEVAAPSPSAASVVRRDDAGGSLVASSSDGVLLPATGRHHAGVEGVVGRFGLGTTSTAARRVAMRLRRPP
jgi:hypothetical protein